MLGRVQNQHIWLWHPQMFPAGQGNAHLKAWLADFHLALKPPFSFASLDHPSSVSKRGKVLGLFIYSFSRTHSPKDCPVDRKGPVWPAWHSTNH